MLPSYVPCTTGALFVLVYHRKFLSSGCFPPNLSGPLRVYKAVRPKQSALAPVDPVGLDITFLYYRTEWVSLTRFWASVPLIPLSLAFFCSIVYTSYPSRSVSVNQNPDHNQFSGSTLILRAVTCSPNEDREVWRCKKQGLLLSLANRFDCKTFLR
jgi:hypothetical protein